MCLFAPYYIIERKLLSVLKVKRLVCNKNLLRQKQLCSFQTIRAFCFAISMFLNHCNKFFASLYIIEHTTIINCCDGSMLFFFASHLHTHVLSLYKNNHTLGLKSIFDALFYFTSETLLHLKSMTKNIHYTCYLA